MHRFDVVLQRSNAVMAQSGAQIRELASLYDEEVKMEKLEKWSSK